MWGPKTPGGKKIRSPWGDPRGKKAPTKNFLPQWFLKSPVKKWWEGKNPRERFPKKKTQRGETGEISPRGPEKTQKGEKNPGDQKNKENSD